MLNCVFCDQENPSDITNCRLCGAPLPSGSEALSDEQFERELRRLVHAGQHVQAVAAYRRRKNVDLTAAQQAIAELELYQEFDVAAVDANLERRIIGCLERGAKIEAIKLFRDETNTGLKEAKDAVEAIEVRVGLAPPPSTGGGCLGMVLALALTVATVLTAVNLKAFG